MLFDDEFVAIVDSDFIGKEFILLLNDDDDDDEVVAFVITAVVFVNKFELVVEIDKVVDATLFVVELLAESIANVAAAVAGFENAAAIN